MTLQQHQWKRLVIAAQQTVDATVRALPPPLRRRARQLPISFDAHPSEDLVKDGVEADTLGLFVGRDCSDWILLEGYIVANTAPTP